MEKKKMSMKNSEMKNSDDIGSRKQKKFAKSMKYPKKELQKLKIC